MTNSRRDFLIKSAAVGAAVWIPTLKLAPEALASSITPPNFPSNISLFKQQFENWSGAICIDEIWTCTPTNESELLQVVNWAANNNYRARPRGMSHNWSPLNVNNTDSTDTNVVMMDMVQNFTGISVITNQSPKRVQCGAGALMDDVLQALEDQNLALTAHPAPGDITVGGALAIGGHGTAVPANGENRQTGQTYGSMSNAVLWLKAVVYDPSSSEYIVKTFQRDDPNIGPLLVHFGRALITEVMLQAGALQKLQCKSRTDIHRSALFAHPDSWQYNKMERFLDQSGRLEAIWFPFTDYPWLKVWTRKSNRPWFSRKVHGPYNYKFADNLTEAQSDTANQIITGAGFLTPLFGNISLIATNTGLLFEGSFDIWGKPKNTMLYVKPTTLRMTANGYAIHCRRSDVQKVIHEFTTDFRNRLTDYSYQNKYPMNGPVEIRVTGLDDASECDLAGAVDASLSPLRPFEDKPYWDTAVWLDILSFPNTPDSNKFFNEVEQFIYDTFSGDYAGVRVEWSKGWAYTDTGTWDNNDVIQNKIPDSFRNGIPASSNWDAAVTKLNSYDPDRVFMSPLLEQFF